MTNLPDVITGGTVIASQWNLILGKLQNATDTDVRIRGRVTTVGTSIAQTKGSFAHLYRGEGEGVWASQFASTGAGTPTNPWPISAIINACRYVVNTKNVGRTVNLDSGVFSGATAINLTWATNVSNLTIQGQGMGSPNDTTATGTNTLIYYTGSSYAMHIGNSGNDTNRVTLRDFTILGTSSGGGGIRETKLFRSSMENLFVFGFTANSTSVWGIRCDDSFAGQFNNLYIHNCTMGMNLNHTSNNGYQAQLGFIELDGYAIGTDGRIAVRMRGLMGFTAAPIMVVGYIGTNTKAIWMTSCKGITLVAPYVEGYTGHHLDTAYRIDNSQSICMTSPLVTRCDGKGFWEFGNSSVPVLINPQFGNDSGSNSTGVAYVGSFHVIEPRYQPEWTGTTTNRGVTYFSGGSFISSGDVRTTSSFGLAMRAKTGTKQYRLQIKADGTLSTTLVT